jgi:hypothetical protein
MAQEHNPPVEKMHQQARLEAAPGLAEGLLDTPFGLRRQALARSEACVRGAMPAYAHALGCSNPLAPLSGGTQRMHKRTTATIRSCHTSSFQIRAPASA